jgi:hypothetical protein
VKKGDWIEQRDAPNTRGYVKSISNARHAPKVTLLLSGCSGIVVFTLRELEDGWEPMGPVGTEVPYWCRKGNAFKPLSAMTFGLNTDRVRAVIFDIRDGWVAYFEHFKGVGKTEYPRFMMLRWWEFRKSWEPMIPPNAWERVLNLED